MIKRAVHLSNWNFSVNQWNHMTNRYSDSRMIRKGRCLMFEGSEADFDKLIDELHQDESNQKVIGIFNA